MFLQRSPNDERGFTLVEVLIVIVLMGIVLAIASSSWFGVVRSRQVDSATNQLAADLRQAHSKAINRLQPQTVTLVTGNSQYTMTGVASSVDLDDNNVADVVAVSTGATITFCPNGSAEIPTATPACSTTPSTTSTTLTVRSTADTSNNNTIRINPVTSRVQVVP